VEDILPQLLNIASLGSVFSSILGARCGPAALLWIVFGTLLAGGFPTFRANFDVIWRYFGWANQTLAAIVLWTAAAYCIKRGKNHWIATIPAFFMTIVTDTYLCNAKIGFNMPMDISTIVGVISGVAAFALFMYVFRPSASAKMAPDNA
jgi:carbon starvation protein CstA